MLARERAVPILTSVGQSRGIESSRWEAWTPLTAILVLQGVVTVALARNTAFQDEANYLYAGRQTFEAWLGAPLVLQPWASYLSGYPYVYPLLAGILDMQFGLEAVRLLSLAWMMLATTVVYSAAGSLYDRESAFYAAAIYAVQGPVLFLSGLATYDAMTVGWLAISFVLALRVSSKPGTARAVALGLLLVMAFITKYAGMLFIPSVIAIAGWQTWRHHGWKLARRYVATTTGVVVALIVIFLITMADARHAFFGSTAARVIVDAIPRSQLIRMVTDAGWPMILAAFVGTILGGRKHLPIAIILFGTALLAPAYHIYKQEPVSLYKHLAYGFMFGAPVAGHALARLVGYVRSLRAGPLHNTPWIVGLAACLLLFGSGLQQAEAQYNEWPNARALVQLLRTQVRPTTRILAEEYEVPRYYLQDVMQTWQWTGLDWLDYTNSKGQTFSDNDAYRAAIDDGYFDIVVLRFGFDVTRARMIEGELERTPRYSLLAELPFTTSVGTGQYKIWIRNGNGPPVPRGG